MVRIELTEINTLTIKIADNSHISVIIARLRKLWYSCYHQFGATCNILHVSQPHPSSKYGDFLKYLFFIVLAACFFSSHVSHAVEPDQYDLPWAKAGIRLGYFITSLNTNLRFGTGLGIDIDAEWLVSGETDFCLYRFNDVCLGQCHVLCLSWVDIGKVWLNEHCKGSR